MEVIKTGSFPIVVMLREDELSGIIGAIIPKDFTEIMRNTGFGWIHEVKMDGSYHTLWGIIYTCIRKNERLVTGLSLNNYSFHTLYGIGIRRSTVRGAKLKLRKYGFMVLNSEKRRKVWYKNELIFEMISDENGTIERCCLYLKEMQ